MELNTTVTKPESPRPGAPCEITVCICTFRRPTLLKRLLSKVAAQTSDGLFTVSIVVVDNDPEGSGAEPVHEFIRQASVAVEYDTQPEQSIALTRNKAVGLARGEFIAFIDDDEFPSPSWLLNLYRTCIAYDAAGVLGPVLRHFDDSPPAWIVKGNFFVRPNHPTGTVLHWSQTRTGNVLFRKNIVEAGCPPFRPEFRSGSDVDFFRTMMGKGHRFVWAEEADVFEVVPPSRWKRRYMMRRALLRGVSAAMRHEGFYQNAKSIVAVPVYAAALPFAQLLGHHWFMTLAVKLCDHLGRVLTLLGANPIKDAYVSE
jgi:succinoglycan biosynthesis protein ExoM